MFDCRKMANGQKYRSSMIIALCLCLCAWLYNRFRFDFSSSTMMMMMIRVFKHTDIWFDWTTFFIQSFIWQLTLIFGFHYFSCGGSGGDSIPMKWKKRKKWYQFSPFKKELYFVLLCSKHTQMVAIHLWP